MQTAQSTGAIVPAHSEFLERFVAATEAHGTPCADPMVDMMMKHSVMFMAGEVLRGPPEPPYNGRFLVDDIHLEWDNILTTQKRFCVLAPRDHGKTAVFDFAYPIWKIINNPGGKGVIFSGSETLALRILDDIKSEIEQNPRLQYLYPGTRNGRWAASQIQLSNGHRITARGFMTKMRGTHPGWIMCDDILDESSMFSETARMKAAEFFFGAVSNMVIPGGTLGVVGTPFFSTDLYCGDLASNSRYFFIKYPAIKEDGTPLVPDRYDLPALDAKREEIGEIRFAREYMCEPVTDQMSMFPGYLFYTDRQMMRSVCLGEPLAAWQQRGVSNIVLGVDLAFSNTVGSDYFVVWVQGTDERGNRWIIDIHREKGLAFQRQKQLVYDVGTKYDPDIVHIESVQAQRILADELIEHSDLPIRHYHTGSERNTLTDGIPSLRILLELGKYRIPRGDAHSIELTDIWIKECQSFTFVKGRPTSVGGHDDTVLAAYIAEQASRLGGFTFDFGPGKNLGDNSTVRAPASYAPVPSGDMQDTDDDAPTAPSAMSLLNGRGF